jgi:hypothetical protein
MNYVYLDTGSMFHLMLIYWKLNNEMRCGWFGALLQRLLLLCASFFWIVFFTYKYLQISHVVIADASGTVVPRLVHL